MQNPTESEPSVSLKRLSIASPPRNNMARSFVEILPLELRRLIYQHVLSSPTGCITLSRTSYHQRPVRYRIFTCDEEGTEEIRISFLRTCKQTYDEAKDIFWIQNALNIEGFMQENSRNGDSIRKLHQSIKYQIRDVVMDINVLNGTMVELPDGGWGLVLQRTFQELADLAQHGELRSITLKARDKFGYDPRILRHLSFTQILNLRRIGEPDDWPQNPNPQAGRMLYHEYLDVLKAAGGKDGSLSLLNRTLVIDTGPSTFKAESGHPVRVIRASRGNPNKMLQELNEAWGGSLIFNGNTCHVNGECCMYAFARHPKPPEVGGEEYYYYEEEIGVWLGARRYVKLHPELGLTNKQVQDQMTHSSELRSEIFVLWKEIKAGTIDWIDDDDTSI